jgi:hypothetical protein
MIEIHKLFSLINARKILFQLMSRFGKLVQQKNFSKIQVYLKFMKLILRNT